MSSSLQGPNRIVGEIYSSGWSHYHETFENEITLDPISNPDVLSGVLEFRNHIFPIAYNELLLTQSRMLHYRLVYIPAEGKTTTIILYLPYSKLQYSGNTVILQDSVRMEDTYRIARIKITLTLNDDAVERLRALSAASAASDGSPCLTTTAPRTRLSTHTL